MSQEETEAAADVPGGPKRGHVDGEETNDEPMEAGEEAQADARAEIRDLTDRLLRARADYENLKRRVERDAGVERDRVRARVLEDFLQVFEYGRLAAVEADRHPGALAEGVKMVVREFERLLDAQGVQTIGTPGEPFDPQRHDAVGEEDGEPGTVLRIAAPGYLLGERVLRYAKVIVGRPRQDPPPAAEEE